MTYPRKVMDLARRIGDQSKDNAGAKMSAMTVLTGRTPAANGARMKLARTLAKKHKMVLVVPMYEDAYRAVLAI